MSLAGERLLFTIVVALLALVPVCAGLAGVVLGPGFLRLEEPWPADLASHLRFLSGLFLAFGISWWLCLWDLDRSAPTFRLLGLLTICGGLARLLSLGLDGTPSTGHLMGLALELIVVPCLLRWHRRIIKVGCKAGVATGEADGKALSTVSAFWASRQE
jgi:hypothetical protein